ncbi:GNAT family N-acetyltransferase [uncultured Croceitalea sp.]|uniref:GNAT family N-acetyltransferase n=1 Tax=uncultured Croceitalea sp. TaxID=1798908 RepID=UPI003305975E
MLFDFTQNYVLENERVILTPLSTNHRDDLKKVAKEALIWKYFLGNSNGYNKMDEYLANALQGRENSNSYSFTIFDKEREQYAGSTRFFDFSEEFNTVRMGYSWIGQKFWGTRLNKNCKYLLFEFAFDTMGFERIGLGAHSENIISIAAMKSLGCKQEGIIRNIFPSIDGEGRSDAILFGALKEEWYASLKDNLKNRL